MILSVRTVFEYVTQGAIIPYYDPIMTNTSILHSEQSITLAIAITVLTTILMFISIKVLHKDRKTLLLEANVKKRLGERHLMKHQEMVGDEDDG